MEDKINQAEVWYDKNARIYKQFSIEVAHIIEKILEVRKMPYQSITNRVKERESYLNKCKKDKYFNPVEEIMDLAGVRIIAYTNSDVKKICDIIEEHFKIDNDNSEDKAKKMDENKVGYLSVHYIAQLSDDRVKLPECSIYKNIKCEIQVRTLLQHAWAEIEHDRNYKFSVELPQDIKRRFHLVAGVLEMMDREFDNLSKEIDDNAKVVKEKTKQGNFDIDIDTESLSQYLLYRFKEYKHIETVQDGVIVNKSVIKELLRFGYTKICDIDQALTEELLTKILKKGEVTYIGILRDLMILLDAKKYFEDAYNKGWTGTYRKEVTRWEELGIKNIENYLIDAGITIYPDEKEGD